MAYPEMEKNFVDVNVQSEAEREKELVERKGSIIGEGAAVYGDEATAERYGYVDRGLKSRHIQFIALGGTIGTGLFVGIGGALATDGPLAIFLGYTLTGGFIWMMMQALGEMVTWLPLPGAIPQMCARYADPALGFAVGWNQWYSNALTQCAELSAAAGLIAYWAPHINAGAWIAILVVVILALNIFAIRIYGEAEFCFASIKLVTIFGLIILAFLIDVGAVPGQQRLGFHYWMHPWHPINEVVASGNTGRFLAVFSTLVNAAFSYGGCEMVAVAAGESEDPRRNIPKAVRRVFWRILFFYSLGSLGVGVLVPSDNYRLNNLSGARASPWVIGIQNAGISALPSIINAVVITSATSSGNAFLYAGSRYLFALAQNGQAPKIFLTCSKKGLPWVAVIFTWMFSLITFMSVSNGSGTIFGWFLNITTIANLYTWIAICVAALRFQKALKAQGVDRSTMPFRGAWQPYTTWAAIVFFAIIVIFNGWKVFTNYDTVTTHFHKEDFVTAYIGTPIFFAFYLFWKIYKREPFVRPEQADLWTGKAAIDAQVWPERKARNFLERIWFWIA